MRSAFRVLSKILFSIIIVLLSISVLRALLGVKPLTFSSLMGYLEDIDIDFSNTIGQMARIASDFTFDRSASLWTQVVQFSRGLYDLLWLPINLIKDVFVFVLSVAEFLVRLVGFDFMGILGSGRPQPGSGGGGFGGGGGGSFG